MNRICLATAYDGHFSMLGDMSAATLRFYAASNSCSVHISTTIPEIERPAPWYKVHLLRELMGREYDWVFWVDADALFLRFDVDVRSLIQRDKHLYLVSHEIPGQPGSAAIPNTGVLLMRNCDWSRHFLERIWDSAHYIHHKWWENAALLNVLGFNALLGQGDDKLNNELLAHVGFIGTEWNSIPGICGAPHPVIHHYAGMPFDQRLTGMSRDFVVSLHAADAAGVLNEDWQRALHEHREWLQASAPAGG